MSGPAWDARAINREANRARNKIPINRNARSPERALVEIKSRGSEIANHESTILNRYSWGRHCI